MGLWRNDRLRFESFGKDAIVGLGALGGSKVTVNRNFANYGTVIYVTPSDRKKTVVFEPYRTLQSP